MSDVNNTKYILLTIKSARNVINHHIIKIMILVLSWDVPLNQNSFLINVCSVWFEKTCCLSLYAIFFLVFMCVLLRFNKVLVNF